jgi:hypothetical protein
MGTDALELPQDLDRRKTIGEKFPLDRNPPKFICAGDMLRLCKGWIHAALLDVLMYSNRAHGKRSITIDRNTNISQGGEAFSFSSDHPPTDYAVPQESIGKNHTHDLFAIPWLFKGLVRRFC